MIVIHFEHVWKQYHLHRGKSLKTFFSQWMSSHTEQPPFYALQDVSFTIAQGELVGIIGQNGAGKSTLLKLLCGITYPTRGQIQTNGRIGALINLGAGFQPELTGRENIYLYGSIMGLKRQEIARHFDAIVDFAELEQFIDVPVKRYSSGMFVRLGFSTAMYIDPDILLVDEVLAVGDLRFQQKALTKIQQFITHGKGIVFVSHNLNMVQSLCHQVIWLEHGRIRDEGDPRTIISRYITDTSQSLIHHPTTSPEVMSRPGTGEIRGLRVALLDKTDQPAQRFSTGDALKVRVWYRAYHPMPCPEFRVAIYTVEYAVPLFGGVSALTGRTVHHIEGDGLVDFVFDPIPLTRTTAYCVHIHIFSQDGLIPYDLWNDAVEFTIERSQPEQRDHRLLGQEGFLRVPFTYIHQEGVAYDVLPEEPRI